MTQRRSGPLWLLADHVRRLVRDGLVVRSVVFPVVLLVVTVTATVAVVVLTTEAGVVAVSGAGNTPGLRAAVEAEGYGYLVVDDPGQAVRDLRAQIGTDGTTLWTAAAPARLEQHVRTALATAWVPEAPAPHDDRPDPQNDRGTRGMAVFLGMIFTLYGVVMGAGSLVRDRDEGTLDAELSLPISHLSQGLVRWLAPSIVLGLSYVYGVSLLASLMGLQEAAEIAQHGVAALSTGCALGLASAAGSGRQRGFAGAMSLGLVATFVLWGFGVGMRDAGLPIPVVSLISEGANPGLALVFATGVGLVSASIFAWRGGA